MIRAPKDFRCANIEEICRRAKKIDSNFRSDCHCHGCIRSREEAADVVYAQEMARQASRAQR